MSLKKAAESAVALASPKKGEKCLVITDGPTMGIGKAIYNAAKGKCNASLATMGPTGQNGREPPREIAEAMMKADIIFAPTAYSMTHTEARRNAIKNRARMATLPGITREVFIRGMSADNDEIRRNNMKIDGLLKKTSVINIVADGTAFWIKYDRRATEKMRGERKFQGGLPANLPWGEVCFAPKDASGYITINHSKSANRGTRLEFKGRRVTEVLGDDSLKKRLWSMKNARNIAELGIGTNPNAKVTGNTLEDEKALGTCHIAVGDSKSLGGSVACELHQDFVINRPSIWFDEKKVMHRGELL